LPCQCVLADLYISTSTGQIISGQSSFFTSNLSPSRTIDLDGNILSPGLIDVQINGAYGIDFSELDLEAEDGGEGKYIAGLEEVARRLVETGTTSFVPTIITQKEELYSKVSYCPGLSPMPLPLPLRLPSGGDRVIAHSQLPLPLVNLPPITLCHPPLTPLYMLTTPRPS
jgi:hypothetical protein